MNLIDLRNTVIENGIVSVNKHAQSGDVGMDANKRLGALAGFDICRRLETMEAFEQEIETRQKQLNDLKHDVSVGKVARDDYWRERYALLQIEFVFEVMKVAFPGKYRTLSARAVSVYGSIVGTQS